MANQPRLVSVLNHAIKGAVLTAVHGDLMSKESHKKNIIISSLEVVDGIQDVNLVGNLLDTKFGMYPEISHTRRLGSGHGGTYSAIGRHIR